MAKPHSREVPALLGKRKAEEIWWRHGLTIPVDLRLLVAELGLQIVTFPFCGWIKEMIIEGVVGVQLVLPRRWFRWYVAHAIGHYVGADFRFVKWVMGCAWRGQVYLLLPIVGRPNNHV